MSGATNEGLLTLVIDGLTRTHRQVGRLRDAAERGETTLISAERAASAGKLLADALRLLRQPGSEVRDE